MSSSIQKTGRKIVQFMSNRFSLGVSPVPVGRDDDGLLLRPAGASSPLGPFGTAIDKSWADLFQEFEDAREAWRKNPLARRLVGLITSYTVGNGIALTSDDATLQRFIADFWAHNQMDLRVDEWSDELSRSGELFPVLFTNPASGMSTVRTVPACLIEAIDFEAGDYETELRYKETGAIGQPERWWSGKGHAHAGDPAVPLMLHYAVNRPIGAVRGESDLASILPWLRRYSRWLEDRVRLNAAVRAFLWVVHAPARLRAELQERYRQPPEPGSVVIAEKDAETWTAVAPSLHAADAEKDGRAIRWMIVAGGPGTALIDIGEGEDANQATGTVMQEQRRRFLRRRQSYLVWMLSDLVLHAYQRYVTLTGPTPERSNTQRLPTHADIIVRAPDISPEDNKELAAAAAQLAQGLQTLSMITGESRAFRRLALRLFAKFAGESLSEPEFQEIADGGKVRG
jgi:hypothetical protein